MRVAHYHRCELEVGKRKIGIGTQGIETGIPPWVGTEVTNRGVRVMHTIPRRSTPSAYTTTGSIGGLESSKSRAHKGGVAAHGQGIAIVGQIDLLGSAHTEELPKGRIELSWRNAQDQRGRVCVHRGPETSGALDGRVQRLDKLGKGTTNRIDRP